MRHKIQFKPLKVAMIAPPWLAIPPFGYGGIENVLDVLIPSLEELGVQIELFTIKKTKMKCNKVHYLYEKEQYQFIHRPIYESLPILLAHTMFSINEIKKIGDFDVIHDHNGFLGPFLASIADGSLPPLLHTLHGPPFSRSHLSDTNNQTTIPSNLLMWEQLAKSRPKSFSLVCISKLLNSKTPKSLRQYLTSPIHNGVDPAKFPYRNQKDNYFMTLARSSSDKGQGIAVRVARKLGLNLRLAGLVCDMTKPQQVLMELANPLSKYRSQPDFKYFSDEIFPYINNRKIRYIGDVGGQKKLTILSKAKALLFPIQWDEPFGMAPIEALACGTPVVAMKRGALPEIIEHGVNGFLANNEQEFEYFVSRIDKIDPENCRQSVIDKFSAKTMAKKYLKSYKELIDS